MNPTLTTRQITVFWFLLRFGVAFTFLYASISAFINPEPWLAYFPKFMRDWDIDNILLNTWGGGEFVIGVWLISGYRIFLPSIAAAGLMLGIFITDFHTINIIFRNMSILCTSLALAIISNPHYDFRFKLRRSKEEIDSGY